MTSRKVELARWLPVPIADFGLWQDGLLTESARRLDARLVPEGRVHRRFSVGSPVVFRGDPAWLRVSPFLAHEMHRNAWEGTASAAEIHGVSKPSLLRRIVWKTTAPAEVAVSAEVLTLIPDPAASSERFLRSAPDLPDAWFGDLAVSLRAMQAHPTSRRFPVHDFTEYGYLLGATNEAARPGLPRSLPRDRAH